MNKIISLLLCFLMAFSSFSVVMAADEAEAIELPPNADLLAMQAIGVFDETLVTGNPMTRRQLADVYFRIVLPDQSDEEYIPTTIYFDDILESDFGINIVCQMGIMSGMGNRVFNPDGYVTYIQLVKTLIDFLGYRQNAEAYGGYPAGYAMMATSLGFSKYAPSSLDMVCTADMAAVLFRKALSCEARQYLYTDSDGDMKYNKDGRNYLEVYRNIFVDQGIVTATYVEDTYQYSETGYFDIRIDDVPMMLSDSVIGMNEILGYKVTYFYTTDANDKIVILHYEIADTEVVEISRDFLDDIKTNTKEICYYNEDNKLKKIDITDAYIFYNGKLCKSYTTDTINPFATKNIDGYIRVVSTDKDISDAEYVFIEAFNSYIIKTVQGNHIINRYHPEYVLEKDDIESGDVVVKNILGEVINPESISEYDILNVFESKDGEITKIIITLDTFVGAVEMLKRDKGDIDKITINGQEFKAAANLKLNPELKDLKLGVKVKVMFNYLGDICDVIIGDYDDTIYGYIIDAMVVNPLESKFIIKMLTAKNTIETLEVADNVVINGNKSTDERLEQLLGTPVNPSICRYRMNSDNTKISEITFVDNAITAESDGFYRYPDLTDPKPYYRSNSLNGERLLKNSTVVFMVPYYYSDKKNNDMYRTADPSIFDNEALSVSLASKGGHLESPDVSTLSFNNVFEMYGTKANNPTAEACVYYIGSKDNLGVSDYRSAAGIIILDKISSSLENDEMKYVIEGYVSGKPRTFIGNPDIMDDLVDGIELEVGDVCQMSIDYKGDIASLDLVFDVSEWKYSSDYTSNPAPQMKGSATGFTNERFYYGSVKYVDDYALTAEIPSTSSIEPLITNHVYGSTVFYEYTEDARGNSVINLENGSVLRDSLHHGIPSSIFMYCDGAVPSFAIVKNK